MPDPKYAAYEAANPYFELVRGALGELVDGEHSSLTMSSTRSLYDVAGWPGIIQGRGRFDGPVLKLLRQHRASTCR